MRFYVELTMEDVERLQRAAAEDYRPIREQAAWLLSRSLRRRSDMRRPAGQLSQVATEGEARRAS
jgi:hypothetical protein